MTDRINSLTIVLEKDVRDDDVEALISAVMQLRNVLSVEKNVTNVSDVVARQRARQELGKKLLDVLYPKTPNQSD